MFSIKEPVKKSAIQEVNLHMTQIINNNLATPAHISNLVKSFNSFVLYFQKYLDMLMIEISNNLKPNSADISLRYLMGLGFPDNNFRAAMVVLKSQLTLLFNTNLNNFQQEKANKIQTIFRFQENQLNTLVHLKQMAQTFLNDPQGTGDDLLQQLNKNPNKPSVVEDEGSFHALYSSFQTCILTHMQETVSSSPQPM